jgi:hypothetical protein
MLQWRKSLVCCLGAQIWISSERRHQLYMCRRLFYSRRTPPSFVLVPQQMAAVNFVHFYCVKFCVQMDRKITSNIKIKKYRTVNKRSTNSLCAFLTFLTVINKLISIIISILWYWDLLWIDHADHRWIGVRREGVIL